LPAPSLSLVSTAAAQDAVADFYRGRTVQLIIPSNVGGSVGLYGRLASDHLGRHIPGNPNVILVTMPGAGGVQSVEFIANVGRKTAPRSRRSCRRRCSFR
jgi:tripartite-type tricarboxylate transporter receptor subunit TctC